MATLYADASGALIRFVKDENDWRAMGPPAAYADSLDFDPETNAQIVAALSGELPGVRWQDASLVDGVLYYNGNPVTVNPPGETYQDREFLRDWWQQLNTALDNVAATIAQTEQAEAAWPGLTPAQKQQWLLDHFDEILGGLAQALRVIHGVLRFIRWLIKGYLHFEL